MEDFGAVLKVENNSLTHYSLKDIFSNLADDYAKYALSHRRDLPNISVSPVHCYPTLIEQFTLAIRCFSTSIVHEELSEIALESVGLVRPAKSISNETPLDSTVERSPGLQHGFSKARDGQLYAYSDTNTQDLQATLHLTLKESRGASADSTALLTQDDPTLKSPLNLTNTKVALESGRQPYTIYPLTCETQISLTLFGEIITYDLESMPSEPHIIIELLKATKSERGNYIIAGAFYRRVGHPESAKAVLMSMLEAFSTRGVHGDKFRSAFLLLSGCELDMAKANKTVKKDASVNYSAAQTWLQKVFGRANTDETPNEKKESCQEPVRRASEGQTLCTCQEGASQLSRRDISRMEREIQYLRDRNSNQQSQLSSLRSSKRKLEDDFFNERDVRRKYQRRLGEPKKERDVARKMEIYTLEQVKMEVLARKRAEKRVSV